MMFYVLKSFKKAPLIYFFCRSECKNANAKKTPKKQKKQNANINPIYIRIQTIDY